MYGLSTESGWAWGLGWWLLKGRCTPNPRAWHTATSILHLALPQITLHTARRAYLELFYPPQRVKRLGPEVGADRS